ncbi:MAG: DVU_1553 family AMP-dependent CoA ligase [Mangrovibacterium sp.]
MADKEFKKTAKHRNFDQVDHELFQEFKLYQLRKTIRYVSEKSRFYKEKFEANHVRAEDIECLSDIEKFPFTLPEDLRNNGFDFLCISQGCVEKPVTFYSSGTTGLKKRIYFSNGDIMKILQFLPCGMNTVVDKQEGVIQIFLPNSSGRGIAHLLAKSLESYGMRAVVSDMEASCEEIMQTCLEHRPNVWFGDAGTIFRVTKEMESRMDLSGLGMKVLFLTMSNISDSMKRYLEKVWNCRVATHYGLTEMGWGLAVDCDTCNGYHYNELDVIAEVVDPETGRVLPDGETGELVLTSIGREAMPIIRFRSGDISSLSECTCGHNLQVMRHIVRRIEGMYQLSEHKYIYPALLEEALYSVEEVIDYRASVKGRQLLIDLETVDPADRRRSEAAIKEEVKKRLLEIDIIRDYEMELAVELLETGALKPFCLQKKRILGKE